MAWDFLNFYPDEFIDLNRELANHPNLCELLANHPMHEWEIKLTEIALYCEVIVHGDYGPEQMKELAGICCKKLKERRERQDGILVIESSAPSILIADVKKH